MTQIKTVCVDKVVYEAVLRNSLRVNDLEDEKEKLQEKLEIAIRALKKIEILIALNLVDKSKISTAYKLSQEALAKIKEIKL